MAADSPEGHRACGWWMHETSEWTGILPVFGRLGFAARHQRWRSWWNNINQRWINNWWWRWICSREGADLGSTLMTAAQGASGENSGGTDYTPLVTTGAVLMALGAVYVGQLARQASDCCLRRLRVWEDGERCHATNQSEEAELSDDGSYMVISEDEEPQRTTSSKSRRQSGSKSTGANNTSLRNSTSSCAGASLNSSSRSGFSTGGSASSDGVGSFSQRMPRQSGYSSTTGDVSSTITDVCGESGAPENSTSLRLRTQSGTAGSWAAGEPADDAGVAAASQSIGALNSSVGDAGRGKGSKGSKKNPWNAFQQRYKGKGLNSTAIAQLYKSPNVMCYLGSLGPL